MVVAAMIRDIVLVYNPKSGSAQSLATLRRLFAEQSISITKAVSVKDDIKKALRTPIKNGAIIAAIGGDGTLSNVAAQLVGTKATFVPLPGGTFNNFTKDLGISQPLAAAIAALPKATKHTVDIGEVNGIYFLNNSGIGLYPRSLRTRRRLEDRLGKWPAAIVAVVRALIRHRTYTFTIDGDTLETSFIYVGNNIYTINGLDLPRRQSVDAGVLSALIFISRSRFGLARAFLAAAANQAKSDAMFRQFVGTSLTISSKKHSHVYVSHDGEVVKTTLPLRYTIHKKALTVLY